MAPVSSRRLGRMGLLLLKTGFYENKNENKIHNLLASSQTPNP
jgi:hypothetical protein